MRRELPLVHAPLLLHLLLISILSAFHGPFSSEFFFTTVATAGAGAGPRKVPVGLVLDLSINSVVGRTSRTSVAIAVEDFYSGPGRNFSTRIDFRLRDYNGDVFNATASVVDLIKNDGVVAMIGPQRPPELSFVAEIGTSTHVPIISFSSTATALSRKYTPYFIRAANNDTAQAAAVAALAQAFDWRQVVLVYEDSDYGSGFVPLLVDALKDVADCRVSARAAITPGRADKDHIRVELLRLNNMQTRVFVVHARRALAENVFDVAAEEDMMHQGYAWIITESVASLLDALRHNPVLEHMQGVVGVRPQIPVSPALTNFKWKWKKQFVEQNPQDKLAYDTDVSTFMLWAYDTVFAVAEAVESVYGSGGSSGAGSMPVVNKTSALPTSNDLSALPVSPAGERLLNAILTTRIRNGISGEFQLVDGELRCTAFEIVNVNGRGSSTVGYWTESRGLSRKLNLSAAAGNPTERPAPQRNDLELIKWPGGTGATPKGWVPNPVKGKRMRVYVPGPTEPGFHSFLQSDMDNSTNTTGLVSGFVIDVFEAAVKELPYAIIWEYETSRTPEGKSIGNYTQLVQLVQNGTYDAIVGDVTITAHRAEMVEFTLPYTTSGVRMVVPNRDDSRTSLWIFLKPLTNSLWICSGIFFVWIGIAIWIMEHRENEEFRGGSVSSQIGMVFYFAFSTLVFAHGQSMNGNFSRFALLVWLFVVWILQSSYTASLTSMLTVNQAQPTVAEITDLLSSREYIGYLQNSFVKKTLTDMGFDEKRLKPYKSPQQYADALARGSGNDGVGAVVDEIPYLKIFLKDYCSNYSITGKTIRAGGFGFVFPKGSPLVADLSRAILNITEGDVMAEIERKWFGDESACPSDGSPVSSNRLDLDRFGGLFIITGATSVGALLCFLTRFFYNHGGEIARESEGSMVSRAWRKFDERKWDGNYDGSVGGSTLRRRHSSHTHVCPNCKSSRTLGGGGDVTPSSHGHPAPLPVFISITSTSARTSVDTPPTGTATPSVEMSPDHSSPNTESSRSLEP